MASSHHISQQLLDWFGENQRSLPWRKTYSPYHIWISEIMLQQTQMDRGVEYFLRWIERFPDIASIALADEHEVLKMWEGLGYYSRARNIKKAAEIILKQFAGQLPNTHTDLLQLPGIGPYTAGAIMSMAYSQDYPVVDTNVERVLSRMYDIDSPIKDAATRKQIWQKAHDLLPTGKARFFNQAMMELGALICLSTNPKCTLCPFAGSCQSLQKNTIHLRPVLPRKEKAVQIKMATAVLLHDDKIFIQKRPATGVWANLWEFPGGRIEAGESPAQAAIREYMEETSFPIVLHGKIATVKHSYMQYRVTLHCFRSSLMNGKTRPVLTAAQEHKWIHINDLEKFAFPAGHRKLVRMILADTSLLLS